MKKAALKFNDQSRAEMSERFQPLYLANKDLNSSKQIRIFINSSKKHCYIQENGLWQEIIINHSLLGAQKETYYFQVQNLYHYLEIDHDDAYLALADSDRKIFFKNLDLFKEILQEFEANLEQLNTSAMAKTKSDAKEILELTRQMTRMNAKILCFEKILPVLIDAIPGMERLDNDKTQQFTADLFDLIKLFKRQKHYCEYVKFKAQTEIHATLTINNHKALEDYKRKLLELNLQKKEITRSLQDEEQGIAGLENVKKAFADSALEDVVVTEKIDSQIKLINKNLQKNSLRLQKIEEEIKVLVKPEGSDNAQLASPSMQSLFFNGVIKSNLTQPKETDVKNLTL